MPSKQCGTQCSPEIFRRVDSGPRIADDLDALRGIIPGEVHDPVADAVNRPAVEDLDI